MKKLLTLLLTLVMAICLVNLNGNHTKAKDNTDYTFAYNGSSWDTTYAGENISKGSKLTFTSNQTSKVGVIDAHGARQKVTSSSSYTYIVEHNNTTVDTSKSPIVINDPEVKTAALIYYTDGYWYKNSVGPENKLNSSDKLSEYGITKNDDGVYTFEKDLKNSSSGALISVEKNLKIIIGKDITIGNDSGQCINVIANANLDIDGKGADGTIHKLILENSSSSNGVIEIAAPTSLKDIIFIINNYTYQDNESYGMRIRDNLVLSGNTILEISNYSTNGSATAIQFFDWNKVGYDVECNGEKIGSTTKKGENELVAYNSRKPNEMIYNYVVDVSNASQLTKYLRFTNSEPVPPEPTPSPSEPVVKDESCEKVIGPTWHWNNDKGICEDYGVVGTSTR